MPYIIPNNLLTPTQKVIKPYNCSMIAVDGPQIKGKLNMEGTEIPYESQFTSQIILHESAMDQPILYGFLGNDITFLMIKASYVPNDPNWEIEQDQYIEYYFADDIMKKRYMGKLLLLTGNSTKRIPQIYLTNPNSSQKVYLEIFLANQSQDNLTYASETIIGLYYNNIITDLVAYTNPNSVGSSKLYITDIDENTQLSIPFENINTIEETIDGTWTLIIGNDSNEKIYLKFLSDFNMKQAHSRINWVLENYLERYLTKTYPTLDTECPVIDWVPGISTTGYTYITTGNTDYIIETFISGVTDNRDGTINIYDTDVKIYKENSLVPITDITDEGQYTLYFTVIDMAGNSDILTRYAIIQ